MQHVVYRPHDRAEGPKVRVDGAWRYGELRQWTRDRAGSWRAQVTWTRSAGDHYIDTFEANDVRQLALS